MLAKRDYLEELLNAGLLVETGVDGLYGRNAVFDDIVRAVDALATRLGAGDGAEILRFPSGLARQHFERSGYLKTFPQLAGSVHSFCGDERGHREILRCVAAGEDWTTQQRATQIVLTPAACYPVYPTIARRGPLPPEGAVVDVLGECFRHEPSREPTRLQMFHQREYVRIGTAAQAMDFRDLWLSRARAMMTALAVPHEVDVANDPFFGRAGKVLADSQREQRLKFEMLVPINDAAPPTACISFNYHMDHFGELWDLRNADGTRAHTACVGFGLERLALGLLRHHGFEPARWPNEVRMRLWT